MKILLVNPPVFRDKNSSIREITLRERLFLQIEKMINNQKYSRFFLKTLEKIHAKTFTGSLYGNRAGSRWPETFVSDIGLSWNYPYIMALTTSYLRKNGFEAKMMDCVAAHLHSYKKFFSQVKKEKADIVIIETTTTTIDIDIYCAKEISKYSKVALAGPHITPQTINDLKKNSFISFFLMGEYISSALKIAQNGEEGVYKSEPVKDFDSLPFMARDFSGSTTYFDMTVNCPKPMLYMFGSKGCPFNCTYCLWPASMFSRTCTLRSPENIIAEIKENLEKYPYKSIYFDDDTWNVGVERISKLCDMLKEIGLPWSMMGRLDCSPDWLFDKMVECGCKGMRFGVETFNVDVLKKINKKLERIDIQKTLEHLSESFPELNIHICMMKNLPGQTEEIHQEDMRIIKELGFTTNDLSKRFYQLSSCVPFPGTELYKELETKFGKEKIEKWNMYDGSKETIMTLVGKDL